MKATLKWMRDNLDQIKQCTDCGTYQLRRNRQCTRCGNSETLPSGSWNTYENLLRSGVEYLIEKLGEDAKVKI